MPSTLYLWQLQHLGPHPGGDCRATLLTPYGLHKAKPLHPLRVAWQPMAASVTRLLLSSADTAWKGYIACGPQRAWFEQEHAATGELGVRVAVASTSSVDDAVALHVGLSPHSLSRPHWSRQPRQPVLSHLFLMPASTSGSAWAPCQESGICVCGHTGSPQELSQTLYLLMLRAWTAWCDLQPAPPACSTEGCCL